VKRKQWMLIGAALILMFGIMLAAPFLTVFKAASPVGLKASGAYR
jgi:hypothetical protein